MVVYCGQGLWSVVCGGLHLGQPAACQMSANHVKVSSRTATVLEASVMKSTHKTCLTVKYSSTSTWDTWICGTALWGKRECTRGTVCTLVGRGLPFLPRDSQGRLPVAWVKYDI